jgi:predicted DsbA family dithiol-disulfide isomerase
VRIEKLKAAYEVETRLVHFPLHPDTPLEGRSMAEHYKARGIDPEDAYQRMKGLMDAEGLPYGKRTHSYNSRLAQELGTWADTLSGGGDKLHDALYRAYFVDARNIGDVDILIEIVESVGLDGAAAREVIETRRFKDAVDADWAKSAQYGVTGVPTFVAGQRGVVGAQPYEMIERLVTMAGAAKKA